MFSSSADLKLLWPLLDVLPRKSNSQYYSLRSVPAGPICIMFLPFPVPRRRRQSFRIPPGNSCVCSWKGSGPADLHPAQIDPSSEGRFRGWSESINQIRLAGQMELERDSRWGHSCYKPWSLLSLSTDEWQELSSQMVWRVSCFNFIWCLHLRVMFQLHLFDLQQQPVCSCTVVIVAHNNNHWN